MRRKQQPENQNNTTQVNFTPDDADAAAGLMSLPTPPVSRGGLSVNTTSDLEFFEDLVSEPVLVLGVDISHLSRQAQFTLCASAVFGFSLLYGYLQELLSVQLCSRKLGLFLATVQFTWYTLLSFVMRTYVYESQRRRKKLTPKSSSLDLDTETTASSSSSAPGVSTRELIKVPFLLYLGLSLLRAVDLGMTNLAMQYINYPAKTLLKSSRVVFTMLFGVLIAGKKYRWQDYLIGVCMILGLGIFMHADSKSSAVFQPVGVMMLVRLLFVMTVSIDRSIDQCLTKIRHSFRNLFSLFWNVAI
jgi:hypothetical protein